MNSTPPTHLRGADHAVRLLHPRIENGDDPVAAGESQIVENVGLDERHGKPGGVG